VRNEYPAPSDQQWEAIRSTDEHLLVSASAGTGKTFTVVTKILYLLGVEIRGERCASPIGLSDIAAVTFTNKAAAELKSKLRDALRSVGRRADAYRIDGARIGTIHTLCANILREFALRTGRAPSPQLVEEAESMLLRGAAVRDALLAALEDGTIAGLDEIVATYTVDKIEAEVCRLINQGDQLSALIARAGDHPARERAILEFAQLARDTLVQRLEDGCQVDFDRMISWTRDLIRDDPTVRRTLQRRIRVLFIDEFQDVDPAQREIAYLLAEPQSWRTNTTRLVLVGDPKQSIYRFRNADVTVWRSVEHDFSERGWKGTRVVPLPENRRSVAPILGFVDHTIGKLLDTPVDDGTELQDFEIPYAPMTSVRPDTPTSSTIEIVTVPAYDTGKMRSADEVRFIEARTLADRVCDLRQQGTRWRDIAVLLCGWGAAEIYDQALRDRDVPTYILRDEGFYSCLEVTDVLVALDAIRHPSNDRPLFGFLRSPFVGLADESLLHIVLQCEAPCWPQLGTVTLANEYEHELLTRGIALLSRLGALRDRVSTAVLIETLLEESGYLAHLELLGREGSQRIANLRKLVRMARAMNDGSVGDFLDAVARQREVEAREGEAQLYGENEDVVTITSVHCAKGLDWRVVFWCDLVRTPPNSSEKLLIGRERVVMQDPEGKQPEHVAFAQKLDAERKAETKRLWYVAATRAKDLLVLSGVPFGGGNSIKGSPAELVLQSFPHLADGIAEYESSQGVRYTAAVRRATRIDDATEFEGEKEPVPIGDVEALSKPRTPVVVPVGRGRHSATELLSMNQCGRRHWMRYVVGLKEPALRGHGDGEHANAIKRGLIVHDVLENYEEELELGVLVEAAIGRWDPDAPPPEATTGARYRRKLTDGIETILSSPQYREVLDREDARRELAFVQARAVGEYVDGKIDLIAPGAEGYSIIDVKTSDCDEDVAVRKAEQYAPQRAAYSQAVEAIAGMPVSSFGFQFAGAGAYVGGKRDDDDRVTDGRLIDGLLQLARGGSRELTRFPAECRYCGYKQAGWCPGAREAVAPTPAVPLEQPS
jgi:ATP-dependent helicase/nuclease subunit A